MFYILIAIQLVIYSIGLIINTSNPSGGLAVPVKVILSLSFVLAALLIRHFNRTKVYTKYVAIGMSLCFIGDLINSDVIPGVGIIGSIVFFALAHVSFILAYAKTVKKHGLTIFCKYSYIFMALYWAITILLWGFLVFPKDKSFMSYGVLAYGLWVSTMAAFSWSLVRIHKKYLLVAAGAFMFVISDLFLAVTGIGGITVHFRDAVIWATYILGLMGIIYAGHFITESQQDKSI